MASYSYQAINKEGRQIKGSIEAANEELVRTRLKMEGLAVISVTKESFLTRDIKIGGDKKVTVRDMSVFCRQFSSILKAGVTVAEALDMMGEQTDNKTLKDAIIRTREQVSQGETLAASMSKSSKVFPDMFVFMVAAGEASGHLDSAVARMGLQFEKSAKLKAMVKKAMLYPVVILCVAFVALIGMSVFIIPRFAEIFKDMGSELPIATRILMAISNFLLYKWYYLIAGALMIGVIWHYYSRSDRGKHKLGALALKLPIFGKLNTKSYAASFARTLGTLISSGMGMIQAIDITAKTLKNVLYKDALEHAKREVEQGVKLSTPLKKAGVFPPLVINMLSIGEETATLDEMLDKVAEYYEEETEIQTGMLSETLQPIIIVFMGLLIGGMVLAMYQPMISMYQNIG